MVNLKKRMSGLFTAAVMTVGILSAVPVTASAETDSWDAATVAANMGIGWNLGNTLDAYGKDDNTSEINWGNPYTTKAMIDAVKAKGFTSIRVPVTWRNHTDSQYNISSEWMARVKEVVNYGIDNDMYVILNVHHEDWAVDESSFSTESTRLARYWEQIATEFKDYDYHLVFEGMNEPRMIGTNYEWNGGASEYWTVVNKLDKVFVDTVRATGGNNLKRALMVPDYAASSTTSAMNAMDFSYMSDDNLIASIHAYSPYNFTMSTDQYSSREFNDTMLSYLNSDLNNIATVFAAKGVPVCIGEFSSSNFGNEAERVKWAEAFATKAKQLGFPCFLWDNNVIAYSSNGEAHGYLNRNALTWYSESDEVVDQLIESYTGTRPETPITDGDTEVILANPASLDTNYACSPWVLKSSFDLSQMEDGSYIKVSYDSVDPIDMAIQYYGNENEQIWAKTAPTKIQNGAAYFSKADIFSAYAAEYKKLFGSDPSPDMDKYQQFCIQNRETALTVTKIEYVKNPAVAATTTITGTSLSLGGEIGVNVYIKPKAELVAGGYAEVKGPNDETARKVYFSSQTPTAGGYKVTASAYSAQMDDNVTVEVYNAAGEKQALIDYADNAIAGNTYTTSVALYINTAKNSSTAKLADLAKAINDYGVYAQKYFEDTQSMTAVYGDISGVSKDSVSGYAMAFEGTAPEGFSYYGTSLVLQENTSLRLYFKTTGAMPVITYNGTALAPVQNNSAYYVEIPDISSPDLDKTLTVDFGGYEVKVSALSYVYTVLSKYDGTGNKTELVNLCKALYKYSQASDAYFA